MENEPPLVLGVHFFKFAVLIYYLSVATFINLSQRSLYILISILKINNIIIKHTYTYNYRSSIGNLLTYFEPLFVVPFA